MTRMNRALVIACNFPPDASVGTLRTLRLVRRLAASCWRVDVLTLREQSHGVSDAALLDRVPNDVRVVRVRPLRPVERMAHACGWSRRAASDGAQRRQGAEVRRRPSRLAVVRELLRACTALPDKEAGWLVPAIRQARAIARRDRPDVIFSSGPPFTAHLVAAVVAWLIKVPWVAEFRDPWARAPWRENRFWFERAAWRVCERLVIARADALLFVTDANRADFVRHYGIALAARCAVVPNGCDLAEFDGLDRRDDRRQPFVLLHAGSLYGARNPAALLRAAARAIQRGALDPDRFRIRFIGRVGVPGLPACIRELGLEHVVEFVPHVPRRDALQEMVDASALLVIQPVTTLSIPAKLYEYMAAGAPILALAEAGGETARLVAEQASGIVVPADDEQAIERALLALVAGTAPRAGVRDPRAYDGSVRAGEVETLLATQASGGHSSVLRDSARAVRVRSC